MICGVKITSLQFLRIYKMTLIKLSQLCRILSSFLRKYAFCVYLSVLLIVQRMLKLMKKAS